VGFVLHVGVSSRQKQLAKVVNVYKVNGKIMSDTKWATDSKYREMCTIATSMKILAFDGCNRNTILDNKKGELYWSTEPYFGILVHYKGKDGSHYSIGSKEELEKILNN
jgi:hypothetical protein